MVPTLPYILNVTVDINKVTCVNPPQHKFTLAVDSITSHPSIKLCICVIHPSSGTPIFIKPSVHPSRGSSYPFRIHGYLFYYSVFNSTNLLRVGVSLDQIDKNNLKKNNDITTKNGNIILIFTLKLYSLESYGSKEFFIVLKISKREYLISFRIEIPSFEIFNPYKTQSVTFLITLTKKFNSRLVFDPSLYLDYRYSMVPTLPYILNVTDSNLFGIKYLFNIINKIVTYRFLRESKNVEVHIIKKLEETPINDIFNSINNFTSSLGNLPEINEIIKKIDNEVIDINDEKILKINYPIYDSELIDKLPITRNGKLDRKLPIPTKKRKATKLKKE
ncbi:hypothetical protein H8356DRAFT_1430116 [Neocallimastix lanati (nom. inval.)]|nr:hypothetical protein H8356DRAFT_1430116 [Neocallimastix sp. JGI-2020a]